MNTPQPTPIPPEDRDDPGLHPLVFRQGKKLFVATGAALPDGVCIRSGRKVKKKIKKAIRNPFNPMTWFGGQVRKEIGLSKKHLESYYMALALTYSLLALGIGFFVFGIYNKNWGIAAFGLAGALGCGVFRAAVPIWSPNPKAEPLELRGVGSEYIKQFPEWHGTVPNRDAGEVDA